MRTLSMLIALLSGFPENSWAFVAHEYGAIYTHQLGGVFYLISLIAFMWVILRNKLHSQKAWKYLLISVLLLIVWDSLIIISRMIQALLMETPRVVGNKVGIGYFNQQIEIQGWQYVYYFGRYDFIILNLAVFFFYKGLRAHLREQEGHAVKVAVLLPLFPIYFTDIVGNLVFIGLSIACLSCSIKLYRKDKENVLWLYMVWLSSSYVLFSFSRSFGHVVHHMLMAAEYPEIWGYMDGITGSINTSIRFLLAVLTLFFIWVYPIYLKVLKDREEMELLNIDMSDLNQELETLVAERTMALMGLTVADRVRNPAMLIGCACKRLVAREKKLGEEMKDVLEECKKLEDIVGDFENLLKSRRSMFKYEDINEIVKGVLGVLDKEIKDKQINLILNLSPERLRINTQKNLLRAAIYHVLRNSMEATPSGGNIVISTYRRDEHIILSVSDTGAGIPREDLERVFDPFYSTKQLRFGMGLPLVKQIVSEHLGTITVESEPGSGTKFTMSFPLIWIEKKEAPPLDSVRAK